jgi:hypothetical protein
VESAARTGWRVARRGLPWHRALFLSLGRPGMRGSVNGREQAAKRHSGARVVLLAVAYSLDLTAPGAYTGWAGDGKCHLEPRERR